MSSRSVDRRAPLRILRPKSAVSLAILISLLRAGVCFADCRPQDQVVGRSSDHVYRLDLKRLSHERSEFTFRRNAVIVGTGPIDVQGHHLTAIVADTGSYFVLHDVYEGLALYDSQGRRLAAFTGDDLLSWRERATRPHKWACHPEGRWARETGAVSFSDNGTAVEVITHAGRQITIDPATGQIVRSTLDPVQTSLVVGVAIAALAATAAVVWHLQRTKHRGLAASRSVSEPRT
jgi:hypothetical protein